MTIIPGITALLKFLTAFYAVL